MHISTEVLWSKILNFQIRDNHARLNFWRFQFEFSLLLHLSWDNTISPSFFIVSKFHTRIFKAIIAKDLQPVCTNQQYAYVCTSVHTCSLPITLHQCIHAPYDLPTKITHAHEHYACTSGEFECSGRESITFLRRSKIENNKNYKKNLPSTDDCNSIRC